MLDFARNLLPFKRKRDEDDDAGDVPPHQAKRQRDSLFTSESMYNVLDGSFFGAFRRAMEPIRCSGIRLEDFQMPRIVVVGGESTGKSSLLENITKCAVFPRDRDICTRMPVRLQLTNCGNSEEGSVELQYGGEAPVCLSDTSSVLTAVQGKMSALPANSISETEMVVRIRKANIPNLELIDLPGIRAYPPDLAEKTEKLVRKYLQMENTLVLSVVRATDTRITSDRGYALVQDLGLESKTVMALTRTDNVPIAEFKPMVLDRCFMSSSEFSKPLFACIAVVNRTTEKAVPLEQHQEMEARCFQWLFNKSFSDVPLPELEAMAARMSVASLVRHVDALFNQHIVDEWKPRALKLIQKRKGKSQAALKDLGPEASNLKERTILEEVLSDVQHQLKHSPGGLLEGVKSCDKMQTLSSSVKTGQFWGSMAWSEWARNQQLVLDDFIEAIKFHKRREFLPQLCAAVKKAFNRDEPTKRARFEELQQRACEQLMEEYVQLLNKHFQRLQSIATASASGLYAPSSERSTCITDTPVDVVKGFLLAHVAYPSLHVLPCAASSPTAPPLECEAVAQRRASIKRELDGLDHAHLVIEGLN